MDNKLVITIGRQFGSGGRDIGQLLAGMFGIGYYDRQLISEAARRSGLSSEFFEQRDEKVPAGLWHAFSTGFGFGNSPFTQESLFKIQSDTIRELAASESCVIVGRCADYVLRDNPCCFNVFIHAPMPVRISRVAERMSITEKDARVHIEGIDKERAAYYDFYTDKRWGYSASYHLSIDSSLLGMEKSAVLIREVVEKAFPLCRE